MTDSGFDRSTGARLANESQGFVEARDGTRIYYRSAGTGPAVVLSDGILCEGFVWKYLRPRLSQHFRVIHWNYRGHGRSGLPRDPDRVTIADHASDLWSVLDALGIEHAALAGHSMGTQVCLEAYRLNAARTDALVLMCGSYGKVTRTFHGTDALSRILPLALDFAANYPRLLRALVSRTPANIALRIARLSREIDPIRTRAEDMLPYFEHLSGMEPALYLRMLEAAGKHTAEDLLPRVHVPTLVIAGERDTFTPPRLAEQMARQIEHATLEIVAEGSHSCAIEQPELVNERVVAFLEHALR